MDDQKGAMSPIKLAGMVIVLVLLGIFALNWWDTVEKGTYHINQAPFSGEVTAVMSPGTYQQRFSDVQVWDRATTYKFNKNEGNAIHIRFNDGSECDVEGSVRVAFPSTGDGATALVTNLGYKSQDDVLNNLVIKAITNSLRLTANLMSARASYTTSRYDFNSWAADQMNNGIYVTEKYMGVTDDLISGGQVQKELSRVKMDSLNHKQYELSDVHKSGISFSNLEITSLDYDPKVREQIKSQQEALMAVETSRAEAQKAEQERLTIEAQGAAAVAQAKYEETQKAQVAIVAAERDRETAKVLAEAAEQYKREQILRGEGDAARKRLVMEADGALEQKLATYEHVQQMKWQAIGAYAGSWVPSVQMGQQDGNGSGLPPWLDLMGVNAARELGLDFNMNTRGKK